MNTQQTAVTLVRRPDCITMSLSIGGNTWEGDYPKGEVGISMGVHELATAAGVDPAACYVTEAE